MNPRLPGFVVIGAIRSGTTSLARYLGAHPGLYMAEQKEVRFFNRNHVEGLEWYKQQFAGARDDQIPGEATPSYMSDPTSMQLMAETLPEVRLIASVREPVDRAWSHYWMRREREHENRSFEDAIEAEMNAIDAEGPDAPDSHYLRNSLYAHHLARAQNLFGPKRVEVVVFERLRDDPLATFASVCRFLGVDDSIAPDNLGSQINSYVEFRSVGLRRLTKTWPKPVRAAVARINTKKQVAYPELADSTRRNLEMYFAPHNQALERTIGFTIGEWPGSD